MKSNIPFVLYAHCIPVKGKSRSVICDLHRNSMHLIPNDLYEILIRFKGKSIENIKKNYQNKYDDTIDEYFTFLSQRKLIFHTNTPELFPELNMEWDSPNEITNAILDQDINSDYDLFEAIDQLEELGCQYLQFRFFNEIKIELLFELTEYLTVKSSSISSLSVVLPFSKGLDINKYEQIIKLNPRITFMLIYCAPLGKIIKGTRGDCLIFIQKDIKIDKSCGIIHPDYFSINVKNFTESLKYNSCLNKKISIDINGYIKNCPSMSFDFGNIKNTTLKKALASPFFRKEWDVIKDHIEGCKDCEFRYVCTDCRAYIEDPDNKLSKPLKCGYNPENNTWADWRGSSSKRKVINFYGMNDLTEN